MRLSLLAVLLSVVPLVASAKTIDARRIVVIDAGHGGSNKGAYGTRVKRYEKRITLDLAKRVALELRRIAPPLRPVLTRSRDVYRGLAERVTFANRTKAAAFVSIHLNASETQSQHGFETYILSRQATDAEASRLALNENRLADPLGTGRQAAPSKIAPLEITPTKPSPLPSIVADLKQRAMHARSLRLAKLVQQAIGRVRPGAKNRGVRQAPFDVLMGLKMPAVLVEVGFIDHPTEGPAIVDLQARQRIAKGIARAIVAFVK